MSPESPEAPDPTLARLVTEHLRFERARQEGVVTWAQLIAGGWSRPEIRRAVRRRELTRVHPRVYVDHTGPLTTAQRGWAAVLWAGEAALCGASVLGVSTADPQVEIAVSATRRLDPPEGVVIRRVRHLGA